MALNKGKLEQGLLRLMKDMNVPRVVPITEVRQKWSDLYHSYAKDGIAGAGGVPTLQKNLIGATLNLTAFLPEISKGIALYWMGCVWKPDPTFTYVTASASGLGPLLLAQFTPNSAPGTSVETAARRIAGALHSYTTSLVVVTATNIQSGATAPVPVA